MCPKYAPLAVVFAWLIPTMTHAEHPQALKVCILSGCNTYHSEKSLPPFQEFLEKNYNANCTRLIRQADDDLPGLEQLDDCDVALIFIKRMQLKGDQLDRFKKYAASGRPIVAVRTASHAVQTWLEFDREVLGGNYTGHYDRDITTTIEPTPRRRAEGSHPLLASLGASPAPLTVQDPLYKNSGHAKDIDVLLTGTIPGHPSEPIAWTRQYKTGRLFYTSLGAEETFVQEWFRRMIAGALFWTADRPIETK